MSVINKQEMKNCSLRSFRPFVRLSIYHFHENPNRDLSDPNFLPYLPHSISSDKQGPHPALLLHFCT